MAKAIIETVCGHYLAPRTDSASASEWSLVASQIESIAKGNIAVDRTFTAADPLRGKSLPVPFRHLLLRERVDPPSGWVWVHELDEIPSTEMCAMIAYMDPRPLPPPGFRAEYPEVEHPPPSYGSDFELPQHSVKLTQFAHPHERDAHIEFFEKDHHYEVDGMRTAGSASKMIEPYSEEFNNEEVANKMIHGRKWPTEGYVDHTSFATLATALRKEQGTDKMIALLEATPPDEKAIRDECALLKAALPDLPQQLGLSVSAIIEQWEIMRNMGTWTHYMLECWLNRIPVPRAFYDEPDMHAFRVYIRSINPHWMIYRTEWEIFSEMENVAGSIDGVFIDTRDGSLVLADWKRTKKLSSKKEGFGGRMMDAPFDHIPDAQLPHYCVQLNIYRHILESYYRHRINGMYVVCVHPDTNGRPFVHTVPHMQAEVHMLMHNQRKMHQQSIDERLAMNLKDAIRHRMRLKAKAFEERYPHLCRSEL